MYSVQSSCSTHCPDFSSDCAAKDQLNGFTAFSSVVIVLSLPRCPGLQPHALLPPVLLFSIHPPDSLVSVTFSPVPHSPLACQYLYQPPFQCWTCSCFLVTCPGILTCCLFLTCYPVVPSFLTIASSILTFFLPAYLVCLCLSLNPPSSVA